MSTYVLVHGAFSGGWQYRETANLLRAAGHEAFTPTLTGGGERVHLVSPEIGLETYLQDVINVIEYEDLHDVILVGHSLGGMTVTGVAGRIPERIACLVYLDAYLPENGQSGVDLLGAEITGAFLNAVQAFDGYRLPPTDTTSPDAKYYTPQPVKPCQDPCIIEHPDALTSIPHAFIYCTGDKQDAIDPAHLPIIRAAAKAKADPRWMYVETPHTHVIQLEDAQATARLLIQVAQMQMA